MHLRGISPNPKWPSRTAKYWLKQLQNRNDELQSIVFAAAHDLRSPLVNIAGFTGELEKGLAQLTETLDGVSLDADVAEQVDFLLKTDVPESLRFIKFGNQQMDMLLGGLMRLSRVGTAPVKESALDMNASVRCGCSGISVPDQYTRHRSLHSGGYPDCIGDYSLMSQVFINLLDNAIKYRHPDRKAVIKIGGGMRDEMVEYTIPITASGSNRSRWRRCLTCFTSSTLNRTPRARDWA